MMSVQTHVLPRQRSVKSAGSNGARDSLYPTEYIVLEIADERKVRSCSEGNHLSAGRVGGGSGIHDGGDSPGRRERP